MSKWMIAAKRADFASIADKFNISQIVARLIRNRDVITDEEIDAYINCGRAQLHDPFLLPDMDKSAELLLRKVEGGKKIRIIGDYDVDGICSTYILVKALQILGADVSYGLPDRIIDGYGLNERLVQEAYRDEIDTIITCDNGIAAYKEIKQAKGYGMTVIVTDHHEVPFEKTCTDNDIDGDSQNVNLPTGKEILPPADTVIDPKRKESRYPFREICGAVVAYKLICALKCKRQIQAEMDDSNIDSAQNKLNEAISREFMEASALATVCDVMPLKDENRSIVKQGMEQMRNSSIPGLSALLSVNGIEGQDISCFHLGFVLGPCLNATGRLDSAKRGLELLLSDKRDKAAIMAGDLKALNDSRKAMTKEGIDKASALVEDKLYEESKEHEYPAQYYDGYSSELPKVIVCFVPDLHESIAGIIAGRLREKYERPVIVLTKSEDGVKGSGRSIESYDMFKELSNCKELFTKFGGHSMAAGLSMDSEDKVKLLELKLNESCILKDIDFEEIVHIDMELPPYVISKELVKSFSLLEPFGNGNNKPVFAARNIVIKSGRILGKNQNVMKLCAYEESRADNTFDIIYFGNIPKFSDFLNAKYGEETFKNIFGTFSDRYGNMGYVSDSDSRIKINICYYPDINSYKGRESIQLVMTDFC